MTVLVTGSSGHLGEALMRTLRGQGRAAIGLDLIPGPFTDEIGSIADRALVARAIKDVDAVLHVATLHKPHVATHAREGFVETNVRGALILLEEAARARVRAFVMTSTTSAFGDALKPPPGQPAAWIDERVAPVPKNIYGVTKTAAEDLCQLFHRNEGLARSSSGPRASFRRRTTIRRREGLTPTITRRRTNICFAASPSRTSSTRTSWRSSERRRSASANTSSARRRRSCPRIAPACASKRRRS